MKRFMIVQLALMIMICLVNLPDAMALGLGFYVDLPVREGDGDNTYKSDFEEYDFHTDDQNNTIGFVLDTALATDSLFNYRLNLGYGKWEWEERAGNKLKLDSYILDNTFGFGVFRNKVIRLWIGPQIRFSVMDGKYMYSDGVKDTDWKYSYVGFGFAPVIGVNFNPGNLITGSMTMGYRFMRYYGDADFRRRDNRDGYYDYDYRDYEYKYENDEKQFFMNIAIFFRLHDKF